MEKIFAEAEAMILISGKSYLPLKRLMDIAGSLGALLILSPLMVGVALRVKRELGSPVIFAQPRPGRGEKIFMNYKFRSMRQAVDASGRPLPDRERLTPFGRRLRRSSLDELPELWNVLKGDMSLVGPRPLLVDFLPLFGEEEARRHSVRPGLTGLAQVSGRNAMSWEKRLQYDLEYVDRLSLWLDLKILWRTVAAVLRRDGIDAGEGETVIAPPTEIKRPRALKKIKGAKDRPS